MSQEAQRNNNSHLFAYLAEVSGLGILGKEQESANALERLKKVEPDISVGFVEQSLPMATSDAKDRFLQGLKLADMD